ncbi:F-box domain-containing protein [Mycena chlorophos]|uniref:F-box domain-containing protein n=1 Tax=Mycena chlorophos TaxID=658473 RepID=A0A8H6SV86_MYCCL|nr:F-box domain-containing protein [Mycena chlorophos]
MEDSDSDSKGLRGEGLGDAATHPTGILALPNEVLAEIFTHHLPAYPLCPPLYGADSPEFLRTICSRWRDLALYTPSLWRAIRLGPHHTLQESKRFQEWVQRSGSSPLSLVVNIANASDEDQSAAVLRLLSDHRRRWEYITLALKPSEVDGLSGSAPLLVRFQLIINTDKNYQTPIRFEDADRLRILSLWNVPRNDDSVRWEQLTCLSLFNVSVLDAARTVALAPNLRCCAFSLGEVTNLDPGTFIEHHRIHTLVLIYFSNTHLDAFVLPALRRLEISGFIDSRDAVDPVKAFVERSRCRLTHLRLADGDGGDSDSDRARSAVASGVFQSALPGTLVATVRRPSEQGREDEDRWITDEYWQQG